MQAVQAVTLAKISNIVHTVEGFGASLTNAHGFQHRPPLLVLVTEATLTNGLPHEIGNRSLLAPRTRMQRIPEMIIEVKLRSSHDVCYTLPVLQ